MYFFTIIKMEVISQVFLQGNTITSPSENDEDDDNHNDDDDDDEEYDDEDTALGFWSRVYSAFLTQRLIFISSDRKPIYRLNYQDIFAK